jgi:hypothetical protein
MSMSALVIVLLIAVAMAKISPFDPASCTGKTPMNMASKFAPGGQVARFLNYSLLYERRDCTQFTGCTPWTSTQPNWGGANGSGPSGSGLSSLSNYFYLFIHSFIHFFIIYY